MFPILCSQLCTPLSFFPSYSLLTQLILWVWVLTNTCNWILDVSAWLFWYCTWLIWIKWIDFHNACQVHLIERYLNELMNNWVLQYVELMKYLRVILKPKALIKLSGFNCYLPYCYLPLYFSSVFFDYVFFLTSDLFLNLGGQTLLPKRASTQH